MNNWVYYEGDPEELVLSSRTRLARNLKEKPFPNRLDEEDGRKIVKLVEDAFYTFSQSEINFKTVYLWDMDKITKEAYLQKHIISKKLIANSNKAAFITDKEETISIMINEEDHIRLQCITGGLDLKGSYDYANKIDNLLEEKLEYAFNEKLGYLTACPTNLGTGLRVSVMVHLPALTMNNEMTGICNAVTQIGMTVRGLHGEGSQALGNIYQISNQITLGHTEEEIIGNLLAVVNQIVNKENISRGNLLMKYKYELKDKIYRSLGILKSAVILNGKECLELLSNVRMGVEMGIIKNISKVTLNSLLVDVQSGVLQKNYGQKLTERDRDIKRAELVKEKIN
jgi:protein arginine kinase